MAIITYREAINQALREEMLRDSNIFIMGEDIGFYGGAYKVTANLLKEFGKERVKDTPISEMAISGVAIGAALGGLRPVAEIMFIDFMTVAMDQVVNNAAKIRYMFNGQYKVPLVIRTQGGIGRSSGAQHSQCLEAWFMHLPGIKVVMPATPFDAKGLLKTSIRDDNPILFIEHKTLYNLKGEVPDQEYTIPLSKANIVKEGKDITIISYSLMLHKCLEASDQLLKNGINAEILDLRTISPMDKEAIISSVKKTKHVIIVEEDCKTGGVGAEVSAFIAENSFHDLNAPILRIAAKDSPVPSSRILESIYLPQIDDIIAAVNKTM